MSKRKFVVLGLVLLLSTIQICNSAENTLLRSGINKYKAGNYIGSLQDLFKVISQDKSNALAYYYIGMSNAKLGNDAQAKEAYDRAIKINSNATLTSYAQMGKVCIEDRDRCGVVETNPLDEEIKYLYANKKFAAPGPAKMIQELDMSVRKNTYNEEVQNIEKYDNQKSEADIEKKNLARAVSGQPTDEEIANAVKVLAKVGINPLQLQGGFNSNTALQQNPEMAQLEMLAGGANKGQQNDFMAMMPYFMSLQGSGNKNVNPDVIKTMMMSSMLGNLNTNLMMDESKNY